ncbi:MAG: hypothetical protein KDA32_08425 [Phycisphaerales bacterium]|nr:hypothetical protein [Phycisphaerales bacterium]
MGHILGFIKTFWLSLTAGAVAIAAIVYAVMGMSDTSVDAAMKKKLGELRAAEINTLRGKPRNRAVIDAEAAKGKQFEDAYQATLATAAEINGRAPLMADVFPRVLSQATAFAFAEEYKRRMAQLPTLINADTLPTQFDIEEEQRNVDDLVLAEQDKASEGGEAQESIANRIPTAGGPLAATTFGPGRGLLGARGGGMSTGTNTEPKYNPQLRAQVAKARNMQLYIGPTGDGPATMSGFGSRGGGSTSTGQMEEGASSFHLAPITDRTVAPSELDLWQAQVGYWAQRDIVDAIGNMNQQAAGKLGDEDPYVGNMPIKHLKNIFILGYKRATDNNAGRGGGGRGGAPGMDQPQLTFPSQLSGSPPETMETFTERSSNDLYDVLQVQVILVLDQRYINDFVDAMSKKNLFQLVDMRIQSVDRDTALAAGYFYGPDPVVQATMTFELYMLRATYAPLMPAPVKEILGIKTE